MTMVINGSGTITGLSAGGLPDATITQAEIGTNVAGTGPAFSYYASGTTSLTTSTYTKIAFAAQEFDTASAVTSSRFQPLVAGYYQISTAIYLTSAPTAGQIAIYKNGTSYKFVQQSTQAIFGGSCLVYLNGSTDYVEIYAYQATGSTLTTQAVQAITWFQGSMVRAA